MHELDQFYDNLNEPNKSCLLVLKDLILNFNPNISEQWKYRLPFFYFKGKMFCYFWFDKKSKDPYIGFVDGNKIDHPLLEQGDRKRMKVLRIKPDEDIHVELIEEILALAIDVK